MDDLLQLIVFILFILGGCCSLEGIWSYKNKEKKKDADAHQSGK